MISRIFVPLNQFSKRLKNKLWHLENQANYDGMDIKNVVVFQNMIYSDDEIIETEYLMHGENLNGASVQPVNISIPVLDEKNKNVYIVTGHKEKSKFGISSLLDKLFSLEELISFSNIPKQVRNIFNRVEYLCNIGLTYKAFKMINTFIDRGSFGSIEDFKREMKSETYDDFENKMIYYYKTNIEKTKSKYEVIDHNIYLNTEIFYFLFYIRIKINNDVEFIHIDSKRKPIMIKGKKYIDKYHRGISYITINRGGIK